MTQRPLSVSVASQRLPLSSINVDFLISKDIPVVRPKKVKKVYRFKVSGSDDTLTFFLTAAPAPSTGGGVGMPNVILDEGSGMGAENGLAAAETSSGAGPRTNRSDH